MLPLTARRLPIGSRRAPTDAPLRSDGPARAVRAGEITPAFRTRFPPAKRDPPGAPR